MVAHFNSSWTTRVRRDDLLTLHVDGTHGSAIAGLRGVKVQPRVATPKPVWKPDLPQPIDFMAGWQEVPDYALFDNAFRAQWELFIRHVAEGTPFPWYLREDAKVVQLVEAGLRSRQERRWVDLGTLPA
jgi:predicted dehydrogenase